MSIDYAGIFTTAVDQVLTGINATLPVVIPILGIMGAIGLGLKLFRKLTGR